MKDLGQLMKQAQALQERMGKLQEDIAKIEVEGISGGGMVKVTLGGKHELKAVKLDPSLVQPADVEMLEDLIIAAHSDAKKKLEDRIQSETQNLMGGLALPPGFKLPL
jgi:nucleoid-associated protein EbfC